MKIIVCFIALFLCITTYACKKESSTSTPIDNTTTKPVEPTLQGVAPFKIGAAIDPGRLQNDPAYRNILINEYNSITIENATKWATVHPSQNTFNFTSGDIIANFCTTQNKRLHGHCLIWYTSNPSWLSNFTGDSLAWENLFKTHIQTVVAHYKGKAIAWDVVNEAFRDDDGTLRVENKSTDPTKDDGCIWARHLGRDYIARAFQYAHEADPSALLFFNEYGQEWSDKKTTSIINMVADFKARGIPIHGLGLQMHTNINANESNIIKAFQKLVATGLLIHISELDISANPANDPTLIYSTSLEKKLCDKYAFIATQYKLQVPKNQQYGITNWNVGDADSWIIAWQKRTDWPLLFDKNYQKKACYYSFRDALKN